jgi:ribonuclease VapC
VSDPSHPAQPVVLDTSALLALLQEEAGADEVEPLLDGALMSAVNLSEVLQKARQHDVDIVGLEVDLEALGVVFEPFGVSDARVTAELWSVERGLSLGDRACLALASAAGGVAVTAERRWAGLDLDVSVHLIR